MRFKTIVNRALALIFLGLLSACAVSKQGNNYQIGIDRNELLSSTLQEFQLGESKGILRLDARQQLQIKLYDRMKVIDLGQNVKVSHVTYALRFARHDILVVHVPTPTCPNMYRVYQLAGYDVNMWEINNSAARCKTPLVFSTYADGWTAREDRDTGSRQRWTWAEGKLTGGFEQVPGSANAAPAVLGTAKTSQNASTANTTSPTAAARETRPRARFESGSTDPLPTAPEKSTPAKTNSSTAAVPNGKAVPVATASGNAPKPITAGNYDKLPVNNQSEITPVKIVLRDSN